MRLLAAILLSIPLLAQEASTQAAPAAAAEPRLTVEFGNRWASDVGGSEAAYRSVVNYAKGPRVFGADLTLGPSFLFDKLDLRSNGWGGEPHSTASLDAERQRSYRLSVDYRNSAYFNALPSFANLGAAGGVFLNQRSFDVRRKMIDTRLDLFPARRVVPFLAYSRDWGYGTGLTDFVVDVNEYVVPNILQDHTDNYRGGVRLEFNRFHATLEQGGTAFKDDQRLYQAAGTNLGDRTSTFLGQRLSLTTLNQAYRVRGTSQYSRALFTANPFSWIDLSGQILYSRPRSTVNVTQSSTGNFVSLDTLTFFTAQTVGLGSEARMPHTSGSFGVQVRPHSRIRVFESFVADRFHTVAGLPNGTFLEPIEFTYNRQEFNVLFDLASRLTLRGGHRYVWGDAISRAPNLSQTGPRETGELRMQAGLAGLTYRPVTKVSLYFDYEGGSADRNYFRTSLQDYHRMQIRAKYQLAGSLSLSTNISLMENENPAPASRYQFESRNSSLTAHWTPMGGKWFSLLADYTRSTLSSDLSYIVPQTLGNARSLYVERAHVGTAALDVNLPQLRGQSAKLTAGGSLFSSSGSRPTQFYQPLGRFSFPLHRRASLLADWRWYNLGERFYVYEGFRTHQFMLGLRVGL
ncbi:MAG: hypothetical protein ACE141_03885 [Bryobacteraceae bacterium]